MCENLSVSKATVKSLIGCLKKKVLKTSYTMGSAIFKGRKLSITKNASTNTKASEHAENSSLAASCSSYSKNQYIEEEVCNEDEIPPNGMKIVSMGGDDMGKVLLVKQKGKIYGIGTKCTHYGAPLIGGHLGNGRIRCQWHGACFNLATGDIEDFPGLDSLPCHEVKVSNGKVRVRAEKQALYSNIRIKSFTPCVNPTPELIVVVGGGPAGNKCVETLREIGFDGRIAFVMAENYLPYDRIKLSKSLDTELEQIILRSETFYQERNIDLITNTSLTSLDPQKKIANLSNGEHLKYDKIFLATGSRPRTLEVPGSNLKNIFVLRTLDDAKVILDALTNTSKVVILGTSFIGMEAAAYCVKKVESVTVVGRSTPFRATFGSVVGNRILQLYEENKVHFQLYQNIHEFKGDNNQLKSVVLSDGTVLPCNVCIVAIGVTHNTDYLNSSNVQRDNNGAIEVNKYMQTNARDVYAGGDVAKAPVLGVKASIGHWGLASYHGHIAAYNMMNKKYPLKAVPFFWTVLFGKSFRHAGHAEEFDDVIIDGSLPDLKFIAFQTKGDNVVAVTTIARDPLAAKFAELLYEGKTLKRDEIQNWLA